MKNLCFVLCALAAGCVARGAVTPIGETDDAETDAAAPVARERTLACDFVTSQGLDLATGDVRTLADGDGRMDVMCFLGRFVGLSSFEADTDRDGDDAGGLCDTGDSPTFSDLAAIPADPRACAWRANRLCGVYTDPYTPACVGAGLLVRDGSRDALYRLRILDDDIASGVGTVTFEYAPVD
jgi:hypothetical protein